MIDLHVTSWRGETYYLGPFQSFRLSFLWADETNFFTGEAGLGVWYALDFFNIPFLFFVSALILLSGLCGLSNERGTRTLGGLLGIGSVVFYFIWWLVSPPLIWGRKWRDFYFGIGEYTVGVSTPRDVGAVWFLSIGFYLATIGSIMLLALSIRTPIETPKESIISVIEEVKKSIFLSIAWVKRRLPAMFLLLSLLLPWWMMINIQVGNPLYLYFSFPWNPEVSFTVWTFWRFGLEGDFGAKFYDVPSFFFVSALIFVGGLCGLSHKRRIRSLGGLLSISGVVSFFVLVFYKNFALSYVENPYLGIAQPYRIEYGVDSTLIWFLSVGFYLALAGSLMLLLPLIRTLVERLRKRL